MKFFLKITLIMAILTSISCNKNDKFLLEMPYKQKFSVNAGLDSQKTWFFNIKDIRSSRKELFSVNGIEESEITKINPGKAKLINVFGGDDYGNIEKISVQIFTDDRDKAKEIFYRDDVPPNTGSDLDLIATLVDLNDYLEETFNVFVKINLEVRPLFLLKIELNFRLLFYKID